MTIKRPTITSFFRIDTILFTMSVLIFLLWPDIDLAVAAYFFDHNTFTYADNSVVRFIYLVFARIHILYLLFFIGAIIYCSRKRLPNAKKRWVYLLITLVIGPGILVNLVLKDNTLGRPRPQHIEQFGGEMIFTPVFYYSGECAKNCSFVSGHAAIGFYLMAIAWVTQRRRWIFYGIALGSFVGFVRILQGGHFLSDVLFAGWFTYFTYTLIGYLMGMVPKTPARLPPS
ncbi:phosphatase PAP2 family protein [Teredinibacter purpureus]|uniref:phosphatase PAP2 family protein n=1 Tax=Teredinibacter purpureus TaxID=2731756 RepID=UPI000A5A2E86|nr:phosphatase PAP2 family protein [Teredinibacter purpureus]